MKSYQMNNSLAESLGLYAIMFVGGILLLFTLFWWFSYFDVMRTSVNELLVFIVIVIIGSSILLLCPLQSEAMIGRGGLALIIIGAIICLGMLFWRLPEANSPAEQFAAILMIIVGTICVLAGAGHSIGYEDFAGWCLVTLGTLIIFISLSLFLSAKLDFWKPITLILQGFIFVIGGYYRFRS